MLTATSRPYALREFRAMASPCRIVTDDDALVDAGVELVHALERRWSRFRPDSEVTAVNESDGAVCIVDTTTFELFRRAQIGRDHTQGWFNPLVLDRLECLGYGARADVWGATGPVCQDPIELLPDVRGVRLPAGARFDPGGIGKGYAADLVADHLVALGATTAQIELGGDVRLVGENWTGGHWHVRIQSPSDRDLTIAHAGVAAGAVATSGVLGTRWRVGNREVHHLIDPYTGAPSTSDIVQVTAIAAELWWAEIVAKVALLRGSEHAERFMSEHSASGAFVLFDGTFRPIGRQLDDGGRQ